jgi:hypothetical protein
MLLWLGNIIICLGRVQERQPNTGLFEPVKQLPEYGLASLDSAEIHECDGLS